MSRDTERVGAGGGASKFNRVGGAADHSVVNSGPTRGAEDVTQHAWGARPWLARAVKALTVLLPIGAAVLLTLYAGPHLWRPRGWAGTGAWLAQTAVISTATVLVVDAFARRLLPLAGLFNLSLVFPDEAPSRFKVALRAGTVTKLREHAEEQREAGDEELAASAERLLAMVSELNHHDRLTRGHTERVRAYSELIAEQLELDAESRWKLRWAVLLHDIGKLTVPPEILNKDGKPTDEEWAILKHHPAAGAEMVQPLADWLGDWRLAAGQHHERWDGKGYPEGLRGEQISLAGRIVAVADAYDVITSARSYKRPTDPAIARQELVRCSGGQFDPAVVRAFLNVSLGKLRLVGGPLAWLAGIPGVGNLPGAIAAGAANAAVAASVVAATVVGSVAALPAAAPAEQVVASAPGPSGSPSPARRSSGAEVPGELDSVDGEAGGGESAVEGSTEAVADPGDADATTAGAEPDTTSTTTAATGATRGIDGAADPGGTTSATTSPSDPDGPATTTTRAPATTAAPTTTRPVPSSTVVTTTTAATPPVARNDTVSVRTYTQTDLDVLGNDSNGTSPIQPSSLTIVTPPAHANNYDVRSDHTIRYRSTFLYVGSDSLTYRICDAFSRCSTATVTITVTLL